MSDLNIRHLLPNEIAEAVVLLSTLNPDTPALLLENRLCTILLDHPNYQLFGAFLEGKLAGICGAWIATKIWCGRYLEIDNLVVDDSRRSAGIGSRLIGHLIHVAREHDCNVVTLDSYTSNYPSHRLYHRLGFEIWGFHFVKPIGNWKGASPSPIV